MNDNPDPLDGGSRFTEMQVLFRLVGGIALVSVAGVAALILWSLP